MYYSYEYRGRSKRKMGMMYIQKTKKKKPGFRRPVGSQDDLLFTASPLLSEFPFSLNVFCGGSGGPLDLARSGSSTFHLSPFIVANAPAVTNMQGFGFLSRRGVYWIARAGSCRVIHLCIFTDNSWVHEDRRLVVADPTLRVPALTPNQRRNHHK